MDLVLKVIKIKTNGNYFGFVLLVLYIKPPSRGRENRPSFAGLENLK